ncbi:speckle-type POZ protein-like [Gigantopelta aegis]|uniref:speckle-type POZ protein-like n=1 Tax=Gigantopelta aegis TaxID=1735272 RepID=UPI001B88AE68|nr:speckle-type POZ protein-like [Gigantopelta aegis]
MASMFTEHTKESDVVLIVEGNRLHVSKTVLSLASPVFKTMFESEFKEKTAKEIPLPGKKCADVVQFLLCIYPNTTNAINASNVDSVLPLADEYQVNHLKRRCGEYLLSSCQFEERPKPTHDHLLHTIFLADRYDLKGALSRALDLAIYRPYHILKDFENFGDISLETKSELQSRRLQLIESLAMSLHQTIGPLVPKVHDTFEGFHGCHTFHKGRRSSGYCNECLADLAEPILEKLEELGRKVDTCERLSEVFGSWETM